MYTVSTTSPGPAGGPLKIAMIAPPWFSIPPHAYGGVENVCADLVRGLVDLGHQVTLIGAGTNATPAQFIATYPEPPSARLGEPFPEVFHAAAAARVLDQLDVDLVHDHTLAGPLLARGRDIPTLVTMHGPVDGELADYYRALGETIDLVAISAAQRRAAPDLPWVGTVHNAIEVASFPFRHAKENLALFLGRFHPDKGAHLAIDAARAAGLPIILAGKCAEPVERDYAEAMIAPRLGPDVTIFGVADATQKRDLLARAAVLLFPIQWEEPFGMVMIEAMACGTPVVALRRGSVPEVVRDGVTGVICDSPDQLPDAIQLARSLDPASCRAHVQAHFDAAAMAAGYAGVYRRSLLGRLEGRAVSVAPPRVINGAGTAPGELPAPAARRVFRPGVSTGGSDRGFRPGVPTGAG